LLEVIWAINKLSLPNILPEAEKAVWKKLGKWILLMYLQRCEMAREEDNVNS